MGNNNNSQRTSPRFSNANVSGDSTSGTNASGNNGGTVKTPVRTKKRNSITASITSPDSNLNNLSNTFEFDEASAVEAILAQAGDNSTHFHLQKLDLLYQNLEGRVSKLERFVANEYLINTNVPVTRRIAIKPNLNNPVVNNNVGYIINDFGSISNTSTPSNATGFTNINSSSSSTICSIPEPREISKSDLDDYCLPLLQKRAAPSIGELNSIVMNLKKLKYPDLDNKFILSKVREWFRRKREYMSQRIFTTCSKKFGHLVNNELTVADLYDKSRNNPIFIAEIAREANLDIVNEAAAWEFCSEKVSNYLENYMASHYADTAANNTGQERSRS